MSEKTSWVPLVVSLAAAIGVAGVVVVMSRGGDGPRADVHEAVDVEALGRCGQCHARETPGITDQYAHSVHAQQGVACIDCHREREGMETMEHHDFEIVAEPSAGACADCHATEYDQFLRSRHAVPAYTAVLGTEGFTEEALENARRYHPNAVDRPPNGLQMFEGDFAAESGCLQCHSIGQPNHDGSVGDCTSCHGNHASSTELAALPTTCGSCHMGPDHAQLEIWSESRHGVMAQHNPDHAPTCSTCHMSGSSPQDRMTHDVTERLSLYLFAPVTEERPNAAMGADRMQEVCTSCHGPSQIEDLYERARGTVENTNQHIIAAREVYNQMAEDGCITPGGWDEPADFVWFELWHHEGRTAKHGAFMGGADYVQWHGNYEIVSAAAELREIAHELRMSGRCNPTQPGALDPLLAPTPATEPVPEAGPTESADGH